MSVNAARIATVRRGRITRRIPIASELADAVFAAALDAESGWLMKVTGLVFDELLFTTLRALALRPLRNRCSPNNRHLPQNRSSEIAAIPSAFVGRYATIGTAYLNCRATLPIGNARQELPELRPKRALTGTWQGQGAAIRLADASGYLSPVARGSCQAGADESVGRTMIRFPAMRMTSIDDPWSM